MPMITTPRMDFPVKTIFLMAWNAPASTARPSVGLSVRSKSGSTISTGSELNANPVAEMTV